MKLDKIKFARLIAYLGPKCTFELDSGAIQELDELIDIELPEQETVVLRPCNDDIDRLMLLMAEGTRKIEAIKIHRQLTGYGLKESKDAVEKYWVDKSIPPKATLGDIFKQVGKN